MFEFNHDAEQRDSIIFGDYKPEYYFSIARFEGLSFSALEKLVTLGFADPEDAQNDAPQIQEFLDFMRGHPTAMAHGYAVSPSRDDYRVSIEGLYIAPKDMTVDLLEDFVAFCRFADDFSASMPDGCYAWWD
jgi:hypothetical protein